MCLLMTIGKNKCSIESLEKPKRTVSNILYRTRCLFFYILVDDLILFEKYLMKNICLFCGA